MDQIYNDEILYIFKLMRQGLSKTTARPAFLFFSDENELTGYFKGIFDLLSKEIPEVKAYFYEISKAEADQKDIISLDDKTPIITSFILDFKRKEYQDQAFRNNVLSSLKAALKNQNNPENRFMLFSSVPDHSPWSGPVTYMAEDELSAVFSRSDDVGKFWSLLEKELENTKLNIKWFSIHYDHLFGPKIADTNFITLNSLAKAVKNGEMIEEDSDYELFSCTYVRDVLRLFEKCCFAKYDDGKYNLVSYNIGKSDILSTVYKIFPGLDMKLRLSPYQNPKYHNLKDLKLRGRKFKRSFTSREAIYRTFYSNCELPYGFDESNRLYNGRLELLRKLEMDIVKEIDAICKENDIKYFLVGGSLLGAVRHHGFIPWDDDLDVGMLREDYEKFRKICPGVLSEKYAYQSYLTDRNSHYIFDKIRLKNTVFSTVFSQRFPIENGVFVDILVYDKTSKNPFIQKVHIKLIQVMKRVINVRWVNRPRKSIHYWATKICLPFMRLIPFRAYHKFYERLIRVFNRSKSHYYIDSVGMNLLRGAFPEDCIIGEPEYVPFEDTKLPVPPGWDAYLRHWYGDNYMELPPVSSRASGHSLAQMDLGEYVE